MMKVITFLCYASGDCPGGGSKMINEYANFLASKGHHVNLVYNAAIDIKWNKSVLYKLNRLRIYLKRKFIIGYSAKKWFPLNNGINEYWVFTLKFSNIPTSDIYIATESRTAPYLNDYPVANESKYYFIQGKEIWFFDEEQLVETYRLPFTKFTISKWLQKYIEMKAGVQVPILPNFFHNDKYRITIPIEEKDKYKISMLFHHQKNKDIPTALNALYLVKDKFPQLEVLLFGEPEPPQLPDWFHYFRKPDDNTHLYINNTAAIYIGASIEEGFGLTVGEAMLCGQAVACTDNKGYMEMAIDGETALLSHIQDSRGLANSIVRLIEDDDLRHKIAIEGNHFIKDNFSYTKSCNRLLNILGI